MSILHTDSEGVLQDRPYREQDLLNENRSANSVPEHMVQKEGLYLKSGPRTYQTEEINLSNQPIQAMSAGNLSRHQEDKSSCSEDNINEVRLSSNEDQDKHPSVPHHHHRGKHVHENYYVFHIDKGQQGEREQDIINEQKTDNLQGTIYPNQPMLGGIQRDEEVRNVVPTVKKSRVSKFEVVGSVGQREGNFINPGTESAHFDPNLGIITDTNVDGNSNVSGQDQSRGFARRYMGPSFDRIVNQGGQVVQQSNENFNMPVRSEFEGVNRQPVIEQRDTFVNEPLNQMPVTETMPSRQIAQSNIQQNSRTLTAERIPTTSRVISESTYQPRIQQQVTETVPGRVITDSTLPVTTNTFSTGRIYGSSPQSMMGGIMNQPVASGERFLGGSAYQQSTITEPVTTGRVLTGSTNIQQRSDLPMGNEERFVGGTAYQQSTFTEPVSTGRVLTGSTNLQQRSDLPIGTEERFVSRSVLQPTITEPISTGRILSGSTNIQQRSDLPVTPNPMGSIISDSPRNLNTDLPVTTAPTGKIISQSSSIPSKLESPVITSQRVLGGSAIQPQIPVTESVSNVNVINAPLTQTQVPVTRTVTNPTIQPPIIPPTEQYIQPLVQQKTIELQPNVQTVPRTFTQTSIENPIVETIDSSIRMRKPIESRPLEPISIVENNYYQDRVLKKPIVREITEEELYQPRTRTMEVPRYAQTLTSPINNGVRPILRSNTVQDTIVEQPYAYERRATAPTLLRQSQVSQVTEYPVEERFFTVTRTIKPIPLDRFDKSILNVYNGPHMPNDHHEVIGMPPAQLVGVPGCKLCGGYGFIKFKKSKDGKLSCLSCYNDTGYCPRCANSGILLNNPKYKCNCGNRK
jgi:hypothetical protein